MTWLYPSWTPQKSSRRGFSTWDLFYSNWGNITIGTGNGFFPDNASPVDSGVRLTNYHGIAIGSRSTVDRVFVQTQLLVDVQASPGLIPLWVDGRRILDFQTCNIGQPLRGAVLGPVTIFNAEAYTTATQYIPDDGTYAPTPLISNLFEQPELHLVFLQRKQDVSLLNGPRMPMQRVYGLSNVVDLTEQLIRILPIGGRKGLTFQATVSAGTVSFRVGIIGANEGSGADPLIEQTLATVVGVSATSASAYVDITGRAQYLALYATVTDDDGGAGADYDCQLTITDDCCGEATVDGGGVTPVPPGAGGPGDSNCLIYQPGGAQGGPGTFAVWADLMAQLTAYRAANNGGGCYTIAFDDSITSPAVIPAGAYNMTGCIWEGDTDVGAFVNIANGASFTGLRTFRNNLAIMNLNTVTSPISDVADGAIIQIGNYTDLTTVAGGVPFIDGTGVVATGTLYVQLEGNSNLGFYDTGAVISMPTAGSFLVIFARDVSSPRSYALVGGVGAILSMQCNSLANEPVVYPGWAGTVRPPNLISAPSLVPRPYLAAPSAVPVSAFFSDWMRLDASGGAITQPLPSINAAFDTFRHPGCMQAVSEEGGGAFNVTITPAAGDTIEGGSSYTLYPLGTVILMSNGISDWQVVGERTGASNVQRDVHFQKELNHTIDVNASTTATVVGGDLSVTAGVGAPAAGATPGATGGGLVGRGGAGGAATGVLLAGGAGGGAALVAGRGGAGTATGVAGAGGNLSLAGGQGGADGGGGGANGGLLSLRGGAATGAGANGAVQMGTSDTSSVDVAAAGIRTTVYGGLTMAQEHVSTPSATQAITAVGDALTAGATNYFALFTTDANRTLTSTPTIANGEDGEEVVFLNVGSFTLTLQDEGTLAGSNLELLASTVAIAPLQSIRMIYSATAAGWVQLSSVGDASANSRMAPPEQWGQENIAISQTDVVMSAAVSINFDEIKMIRAGSIVGMSTRLTETCTAGTLTVKVSKNGAAGTLSVVTTNASNTTGGQSTQAAGIDTFVAGDRLGMLITTTAGWLPVTSDIEAWLEIEES